MIVLFVMSKAKENFFRIIRIQHLKCFSQCDWLSQLPWHAITKKISTDYFYASKILKGLK